LASDLDSYSVLLSINGSDSSSYSRIIDCSYGFNVFLGLTIATGVIYYGGLTDSVCWIVDIDGELDMPLFSVLP
jgi:hypothetical protein